MFRSSSMTVVYRSAPLSKPALDPKVLRITVLSVALSLNSPDQSLVVPEDEVRP